jgi:hypothetical protein
MNKQQAKEITSHLKEARKLLVRKFNEELNEGVDIEAVQDALESINKSFNILEIYAEPDYEKPSWEGIEDTREKLCEELETIDSMTNLGLNGHLSEDERIDIIGNALEQICDLLGIEINWGGY